MLANVTFNTEDNPFLQFLSNGDPYLENPQTGVYILNHHNIHLLIDESSILEEYPGFDKEDLSCYGVADSVEQVLHYYGDSLATPDRCFFIGFTPVYKEHQPESGGWRWHKWGPYIGSHSPSCEYIHDEPTIEVVWCFHIMEAKRENS